MTAPSVQSLPDAPSPLSTPSQFTQDAFVFVAALADWTGDINALVNWLNANVDAKTVVDEEGAAFDLDTENSGAYIRATNALAKTMTVEPESLIPQPGGATYFIANRGAGDFTIAEGAGVTINGLVALAENATAILQRISVNTYDFIPIGGDFVTDLTALQTDVSQLQSDVDGAQAELLQRVQLIDTIALLRLENPTVNGQQFSVKEYSTGMGSGGGVFYYDSVDVSTADNTITVIVTGSGKRLKRVYETITPHMIGAKGDANASGSSGTYEQSFFTDLEAVFAGRIIDLAGKTYLVGFPVPHLNNYINGSFVVAVADTADQPANVSFGRGALESNVYTPFSFPSSTITWSGGNYNTAIGDYALKGNTSGRRNSGFGSQSLRINTSGFYNTGCGAFTLYNNISGSYNTAVGNQSMQYNTIGEKNTAVGDASLTLNVSGSHNVAIGDTSLNNNTSGNRNICIGVQTMLGATTINDTIAIGHQCLSATPTGTFNLGVGNYVLGSNTTGSNNVGVGHQALTDNTTGSSNTGIGMQCLVSVTTGTDNVGVGRAAGGAITEGSRNVAVGRLTINTANVSDCTAIGDAALNKVAGDKNTAVGSGAGADITTGIQNTVVGAQCGGDITTGGNNVGVGRSTLFFLTSGNSNVGLGQQALANLTIGDNNLGIGNLSGTDAVRNITTASNEIVIGNNSHTAAYIKVALTVTSDSRDKIEIGTIENGLDFVCELKPKIFQLRDRETGEATTGNRYGFFAQDILSIEGENPTLINNQDPENLKLNETMIIPLLVRAVQQLSARIEMLEAL